MSKEAMTLALDALEELTDTEQTYEALERGDAAITALREALAKLAAQPAPVPWSQALESVWAEEDDPIGDLQGRLIAAQPAQQEPVGEVSGHDWSTGLLYRDLEPGAPLYTTPQAQRKPLTDEEIDELSRTMVKGRKSVNWLCRAIEAKLKEKDT